MAVGGGKTGYPVSSAGAPIIEMPLVRQKEGSMGLRIGRVIKRYPSEGKVQVMYEDENSASLPLPMLTMNQEYAMPSVGDRVVTLHLENGSSKGFVLGTYYGGSMQPKADKGYRKDFDSDAYMACVEGGYLLKAKTITLQAEELVLKCSEGEITAAEMIRRLERLEDRLGLTADVESDRLREAEWEQ